MDTGTTLPVWRSIAGVYRFVAGHPRDLARIGWLPLGLLLMMVVLGPALTKCYLVLEPPVRSGATPRMAEAAATR